MYNTPIIIDNNDSQMADISKERLKGRINIII